MFALKLLAKAESLAITFLMNIELLSQREILQKHAFRHVTKLRNAGTELHGLNCIFAFSRIKETVEKGLGSFNSFTSSFSN